MKKFFRRYLIVSLVSSGRKGFLTFVISCAEIHHIPKDSQKIKEFFENFWEYLIWGYSIKIHSEVNIINSQEIMNNAVEHYLA